MTTEYTPVIYLPTLGQDYKLLAPTVNSSREAVEACESLIGELTVDDIRILAKKGDKTVEVDYLQGICSKVHDEHGSESDIVPPGIFEKEATKILEQFVKDNF